MPIDNNKIAFLFPYNTWGGAYRSTYELTNRLIERGYEVDIIFPIIAPQIHMNESKTLKKIYLLTKSFIRGIIRRNNVPWFPVKSNIRTIPFISKRFFKDYDVVIGNHWHTLRPLYALDISAKKYTYIRDIETFENYYSSQLVDFKLPITKICVASWIQDFLRSKGINAEHVLINGTNIKPFINKRDRTIENKKIVIGMCYATHNAKDMPGGIKVLEKIKKSHPQVEILLYGFPKKPNLSFEFQYWYRPFGEKLREIYSLIDIFYCPSIQEGFHNPPREAMAARCSIVATNVGCIPDIGVNNKNMIVTAPKDYKNMEKAILRLIENKDLRLEMGNNAFNDIKSHSWELICSKFEKIINE